jgi:hypothetical protein
MKKAFLVGSCGRFFLFLFLASCGGETENEESLSQDASQNTTLDSETGCSTEYVPICGTDSLTYQNSCYSSLRNVGVKSLGICEYTVCSFNGVSHYVMNNMLYHEDDKERPYIDVLYGTFYQKPDGEGWVYVRAINKESSYYFNRIAEYLAGVTESGAAIPCETTTELQPALKEFLKTHGKILKLKIEGSNEEDPQLGANQTEDTANTEETAAEKENTIVATA